MATNEYSDNDLRVITSVHDGLRVYRRENPDAIFDDAVRLTGESVERLRSRKRPEATSTCSRCGGGTWCDVDGSWVHVDPDHHCRTMTHPTPAEEPPRPDFAALYLTAEDSDLTPRLAALLWIGADLLTDPGHLNMNQPSDWLPPAAQQYGREFAEHMRDVVADLRDRLASGRMRRPRNMAEQVALGAIIDEARTVVELMQHSPEYEPWVANLPTTGHSEIDDAEDILMEDTDHEMFYWAAEYAEEALDPRSWFQPFNTALPSSILTRTTTGG